MPIGFTELRHSALTLARAGNPSRGNQSVARALMFMIQITSEAARFNDVFEAVAGVMGSPSRDFTGLDSRLQSLENAWGPIST